MIHYEKNHLSFRVNNGFNLHFLPHMHQEIEILYVKKGSMLVTLQHTTYTVNASDIVLIMPHVLHGYHSPEPSEHIITIFNSSLISHYHSLMTMQCQYPIIEGTSLHPDVPFYLEALLNPEVKQDTGLQKGYLYLLFTRLMPQVSFVKSEHSPHQDLLYKCLEYIHLNFYESLSLELVARHLGVSSTYVSRLFNNSVGYSFTYYINTLRINYAKYLLQETTRPITQISFDCGYENVRHFNRVFKEMTGTSPRAYQRSL